MLNEYRFTVEHKPGINHNDADGVSRIVTRAFVAAVASAKRKVPTARRRHTKEREERLRGQSRSDVIDHYLGDGPPQNDTFLEGQLNDEKCCALRSLLLADDMGPVRDTEDLQL